MLKLRKNKKGFTLVELIVVVAIMAVLAGTVAGVVVSTQNKTKNSQANSSAQNLAKAIAELLNTDLQNPTQTYLDISSGTAWSGSLYDQLKADLVASYGDVFSYKSGLASAEPEGTNKAGTNKYNLYIATDSVVVYVTYKPLGTGNGDVVGFKVEKLANADSFTVSAYKK